MFFVNRIEELRKERKLTKKKVAEDLGLPYSTYLYYESGARGLNSETMRLFADYFGVSIDYLIGRTEDRNRLPDDVAALREAMRDRSELAMLFNLAKDARTSDILDVSAILQRYKEETENK